MTTLLLSILGINAAFVVLLWFLGNLRERRERQAQVRERLGIERHGNVIRLERRQIYRGPRNVA